jgi:photosystem II stability/assembly factor-like uncharacterized protein
MASKTKHRARSRRAAPHPPPLQPPAQKPRLWILVAVGTLGLAALVAAVIATQVGGDGNNGGGSGSATAGLPNTSDYHSLLVGQTDPEELVLGTHQGLYRSVDGGRSWSASALSGQDAMNLARPTRATAWVGGHNVLAKSTDGGETWTEARPSGLPGLDVHGFASDPRNPRRFYAAIAGQGLYRSTDGGASFELVSTDVGPNVMAMAVMPDGRILAGDMQRGLLASRDGGRSWNRILGAALMGLAVNPKDPRLVLAAGPGVLLSSNGGRSWKSVLEIPDGAGPIAWAPSDPKVAYVVGFDRQLYRSRDGGQSWSAVE